ncbi:ADYC domain-containing protein [Microvirga sp. TS319]|uniref:ADYC domain-containing protein n=1 Tax=Microvirga sp. TS319 TaxID=3241165 RepID=UPI00351A429B
MRGPAALLLGLILSVIGGMSQPLQALEGKIRLEDTELVLRLEDGRVLRGAGLVGLTLVLGQGGQPVEIRVDGFEEDRTILRAPLPLYRMSVRQADGSTADLCHPDPGGRRAAFAFPDGKGGFNLTCTSGAEGKCVLFGYRPWETREGVPMSDLLRACIHLLRADYGGDDRPSTRNGTPINVYDRFAIQHPGTAPGMAFEAAWGPDGAVCVAHPRIPDNITLDDLAERYPRLRRRLGPEQCSEDAMRADPRALIFNQSAATEPAPR